MPVFVSCRRNTLNTRLSTAGAGPPSLSLSASTDNAARATKVELSGDGVGDDEEGGPQRIIVGIDDVVRVMPWFCIEVRQCRVLPWPPLPAEILTGILMGP